MWKGEEELLNNWKELIKNRVSKGCKNYYRNNCNNNNNNNNNTVKPAQNGTRSFRYFFFRFHRFPFYKGLCFNKTKYKKYDRLGLQ